MIPKTGGAEGPPTTDMGDFMRSIPLASALLIALAAAATPAAAQSEADFVAAFAGDWQTLDPAVSSGGACRVTLDATGENGRYALSAERCGGALAQLSRWGIADNQLALFGAQDAVLARLGGNQNRMSGDLAAGGSVVFERLAAGASGPAPEVAGDAACVYYGYTASCARPEDRQMPVRTGVDETARASVLVALNARTEARPDADVVATIPAGTCVVVDQCTAASDGNWCQASVSNFSGWIRQQAVRADRWPVLTYAPGCASAQR